MRWDHPRACGEKSVEINRAIFEAGSPPRVRGKAPLEPMQDVHRGITPARAGKRSLYQGQGYTQGDHPRACGEKIDGSP